MKFYFLIFICLILNLQGCKVDPLSLSKTFATSTTAVNISTITRDGVGYYLYVYDASDLTSYVKYSITNISEIPSSLIGGVTIPAYKKITIKTNPSMSSTTLTLPDIRDYFPPLGTGVGYYLYIYDASDLTKYVKYSITNISEIPSSLIGGVTIPASKKITVKPNLTAVSGDFTINLPDPTKPDEPRKVLVTIMADATEIETRMTTLESNLGIKNQSTVLIEDIVSVDTQATFNALTVGLVYLDMRTIPPNPPLTVTTAAYTTARTFGCSFTVTVSGSNKVPVLSTSYANLPTNISVKNRITNTYNTWTKSTDNTTWFNNYSIVRSPSEIFKIIRGEISLSGACLTGSGFSVTVIAANLWQITFTGNPFLTQPVVVASCRENHVLACVSMPTFTLAKQEVRVQTVYGGVGSASGIYFIAIG